MAFIQAVRRHWPMAMPALFAITVYHAWFQPGLLMGDDLFRFSDQVLRSFFPWRSAWDGSFTFGVSTATASPAYPVWGAFGLLTRAGADFATAERLIWFWPLAVLLVAAPYALAYRMTRSPSAAALAASVFAVNTWVVALVQRGHVGSLVAYAVTPLSVMACWSWLRRPTLQRSLIFAAALTLQVAYDVRYAYIAGLVGIVLAAWRIGHAMRRRRGDVVPSLARGIGMFAVCVAVLNAYWLIPQIVEPAQLPQGYDTLAYFQSASSFESLRHSAALFTPFYHYVEGTDPFQVFPVEPAFYALPVLVALSLLAVRKNRYMVPLAVVTLLGVVVTAGPAPPFGAAVQFAFLHVPGMKLFRDISKFTSLVAFGYSAALALGFARLVAVARAWSGRRLLAAAPSAAMIAIVAYAGLMRDAYNPLRFSNFAATRLTADDRDMQRFLDDQPGFFRTLVFPTWRPTIVGTDVHPLVSADYLVQSAQQDGGIRELFDDAAPLKERLRSALIPAVLREASVRYVVVTDDRTGYVYTPHGFDLQHAEAVDLFRSQGWLKETARFGRYVVFAVQAPSVARAFFAASPVVFSGEAAGLDALAGSPWWGGVPTVITASQTTRTTSPNPLWPMIASASTTSSPGAAGWAVFPAERSGTLGGPSPATLSATLHIAHATRLEGWLHARITDVGADAASRDLFAEDSALTPVAPPDVPTLAENPVAVDIDDPSIMSAPYDSGMPGAAWFGLTDDHASIDIVNLLGVVLTADIDIIMSSPDGRQRTVHATQGAAQSVVTLPGDANAGSLAAADVVLNDVRLAPGPNSLRLSIAGRPPSGYAALLRDDVRVDVKPDGARPIGRSVLPTIVSATAAGLDVIARPNGSRSSYARATYRLLEHAPIPLDRRPIVSLTYQAPPHPLGLVISFELRQRDGTRSYELAHALPSGSENDSVDVFAAAQTALDAAWQRERARHAGDVVWQHDVGRTNPEASDFALAATRLSIIAPPGAKRGQYLTQLFEARLDAMGAPDERAIQPALPIDLRGASARPVGAVPSPLTHVRSPRLLQVSARQSAPFTVTVPVGAARDARHLVFLASVPVEIETRFSLRFTDRTRHVGISVLAAGRPRFTDPDEPFPTEWRRNVQTPPGDSSNWRQFDIDVSAVRAYRLTRAQSQWSLSSLEMTLTPIGPAPGADAASIRIADMFAVGGSSRGSPPQRAAPAYVVDGATVPVDPWHVDTDTGAIVARSVGIDLRAGEHTVAAWTAVPDGVTSMLLVQPPPPHLKTGKVDVEPMSPDEFAGDIHSDGGLLVFTDHYAAGWSMAVTRGSSSPLTGIALLDWLRLRTSFLPDDRHYAVNDAFNGWWTPPLDGRAVIIYGPEAISEASALCCSGGSLALVVVAFVRRRP